MRMNSWHWATWLAWGAPGSPRPMPSPTATGLALPSWRGKPRRCGPGGCGPEAALRSDPLAVHRVAPADDLHRVEDDGGGPPLVGDRGRLHGVVAGAARADQHQGEHAGDDHGQRDVGGGR